MSAQKYAPLDVPVSARIIRSGVDFTPAVKLNGKTVSNAILVRPGNALGN